MMGMIPPRPPPPPAPPPLQRAHYGWFGVKRTQEGRTREGERLCEHPECTEAADEGAVCYAHLPGGALFREQHPALAAFVRLAGFWSLFALAAGALLVFG